MKPLSSATYVKRNIKRVAMTGISILIGVFIVYFFSLITETTNYFMKITSSNMIEKYSVVYPGNNKEVSKEIIEELKQNKSLGEMIPQKKKVGSVRYQLSLGAMTVDVYNLYGEDIPKFLNTLNLKVIEGELPKEGSNEILIDTRYAKQNNLKVNSIINNKLEGVEIQGDFKIVGICDGTSVVAIASTDNKEIKREDSFENGFLYTSKDGSHRDLSYLSNRKELNLRIDDYSKVNKQIKEITASLNIFSYGLGVFIIVILCITLGNLNYITFSNRLQEFFVLYAIGYKNRFLMKKLWKENFIVCIAGYILGIAFSFVVVIILNLCIFSPAGKSFILFSLNGLIASLTIPVFVSFFSLIPCLTSKYYEKINIGI
jgi:putative ABC transport system permease protein